MENGHGEGQAACAAASAARLRGRGSTTAHCGQAQQPAKLVTTQSASTAQVSPALVVAGVVPGPGAGAGVVPQLHSSSEAIVARMGRGACGIAGDCSARPPRDGGWPVVQCGVLQLRISVPSDLAPAVLDQLRPLVVLTELASWQGASARPAGDVITCTLPREAASEVIHGLTALGVAERGAIAVVPVDTVLSAHADAASHLAEGAAADAVVWEAVESEVERATELSVTFLLLMIIAGVLASIALLTDSTVLIIGAMVVGPEYGALAGLCVALVRRRGRLAGRAAIILGLGFALAIAASLVTVMALVQTGLAASAWDPATHPFTAFVARPDAYTVIVAGLAGVAGMLSLTTGQTGALVGVFISVTTIPAAGNVGMAAAYGEPGQAWGAILQLVLNLGMIVLTGVVTLAVQRLRFSQRVARFVERLPHLVTRPRR